MHNFVNGGQVVAYLVMQAYDTLAFGGLFGGWRGCVGQM